MQAEKGVLGLEEAADDTFTTFKSVGRWKEETKGLALGYFPVYFPDEIADALGFLPVGLYGASGGVSLDLATAHTQSFVCSISRSVFQMALQGNLDVFDGLIFSNICDVARNLSGITKRNLPARYIDYIHFPINNNSAYAVRYLHDEYERVAHCLETLSGRTLDSERLRESIGVYNEKRRAQRALASLRRSEPWLLSFTEWHRTMRAGLIMPVRQYVKSLNALTDDLRKRESKSMDKIRVAVIGNFCEQPPLMLMKVIEDAGCYIINDESLIGPRWLGDVGLNAEKGGADPLQALAEAYIGNTEPLTVRFHPDINKQDYIQRFLGTIKADGVIFLTPKFCEPALYDYMIYKAALDKTKMPYLHLEYEESSSSFEHTRTMVETFAESILFD